MEGGSTSSGDSGQIDIQYENAVEWLVARRKLKEDWPTALRGIQAKAGLAKESTLADEASMAFLANCADEIDFYKVQELWGLVEKSEDAKRKNLLGQYTCPEIKAWKQVFDLYKRSNIHIAEAARALVQMARYDVPAAKRQAQACQKQIEDAERRQRDLSKREAEAKRRFREMCDAKQIAGVDLQRELQEYIRTALPERLEHAASQIVTNCPEPLRFYDAFSRSLLKEGGGDTGEDLLPLLRFLIANGNALLKDAADLNDELKGEWKVVQEEWSSNHPAISECNGDEVAIDWGSAPQIATEGVSWELEGSGADGAGISWDFQVEDNSEANADAAQDAGDASAPALVVDGIDWGASFSVDCLGSGGTSAETSDEGAQGVRLLANNRARCLVVDELLELEAFLVQRCYELEERGSAEGQLATMRSTEVQLSLQETKALHCQVSQAVESLCGKQVQPLLLMHSSEAALRHAVSKLSTQKGLYEKPARESSALERRKAELAGEAEVNLKEVGRLRTKVRALKVKLEEEISNLMKFKVRLVGDINTV